MNAYENYLKEPFALEFNRMESLHNDLLAEVENDPEAVELYEELTDAATKYAAVRAGWMRVISKESEWVLQDDERTI